MKNLRKILITLALLAPVAALAQVPYNTGSAGSVTSGVSIVGTGGTTETLPATTDTLAGLATANTFTGVDTFNNSPVFNSGPTTLDSHYAVMGNSLLQNPVTQMVFESFLVGSVNNGVNVLNSSASRKIFVNGGVTLYVSGTAAGATSVNLECQPSARLIATWPIGTLINLTPVGIYASASSGVEPTVVLGSALTTGCQASDSVLLSANGTLSTTSQVFINLPYIVQ